MAPSASDDGAERVRRIAEIGRQIRALLPSGAASESAVPSVPEKKLPGFGKLYEYQNQRYLALESWDQLPFAGEVAEQLGARLVAQRVGKR
ncbi:MAG: hypothetical protein RMK74_12035 [Myxococcales bacterium]|nr:hypothetical protein [Myxococcales bacterium]